MRKTAWSRAVVSTERKLDLTLKILIVNYRSADYLRECLLSLNSLDDCQITILDNASGAAEVRVVRNILSDIPNACLVVSHTNLGFGAGVNLAAEAARITPNDIVWVLNPDTAVSVGAVDKLRQVIHEDRADIVSPLIVTGPRTEPRIWFAGGDVDTRRGTSVHFQHGARVDQCPAQEVESPFITGAAPMFKGSIWLELKGFREDLFLYWEDADLSLRANLLKFRLMLVPSAIVWHREGGSSDEGDGLSSTYYYYAQRNRLVVCSGASSRACLALGTGLLETSRLLLKPLVRERRDRLRKFAASTAGLVAGLRGETGRGGLDWL